MPDAAPASLVPGRILRGDAAAHRWAGRGFQGIPSLAVAPGGRLWAAWYAGARDEGADNHVGLLTSADHGATWELALVIDPEGAVRAFDPALWLDPQGRLWLFWAQSASPGVRTVFDGVGGVWAMQAAEPFQADPAWSAPRRIADGVMMNRPALRGDGAWLLPTALWNDLPDTGGTVPPHLVHARRSNVTVSTDAGASFALLGGAEVPGRDFDEHMLVERLDGSLWMLVRRFAGLGESVSHDGGRTWSPGVPLDLPVPNARFHLRRLASGALLLIANRVADGERGRPWATRRDLTAWLSDDDGASWPHALVIDAREGVSYPDADQDAAGRLWIVHDRERYRCGEILLSCLDESDLRRGAVRSPGGFLARVIDRSGGVPPA